MPNPDDDFFSSLLSTFREDAEDLLNGISQGLLDLEQSEFPLSQEIVEEIFRKTHSLKGASRAVNLREIESISLNLENIFSRIKTGDLVPDAELFDLLHTSVTVIRDFLSKKSSSKYSIGEIVHLLRGLNLKKITSTRYPTKFNSQSSEIHLPVSEFGTGTKQGFSPETRINTKKIKTKYDVSYEEFQRDIPNSESYSEGESYYPSLKSGSTVRISAHKLESLITKSDDLLSTRLFLSQRINELSEISNRFSFWRWNHSNVFNDLHLIQEIFFGSEKLDLPIEVFFLLERIIEFLKYDREFVTNLQHDLATYIRAIDLDRLALETSTNEISSLVHDAALIPVSSVSTSFQTQVREISRSYGKIVDLKIQGGEIEMDRRILEAIKVPLIHLIHNSIDHGIEYPDIRVQKGKPPQGSISLKITPHSGSIVAIELSDDGGGVDFAKLRRTAVEKGLYSEYEASRIPDSDIIWMVFASGFSTSSMITDLSGRGLGLAIVEDTITRLGGKIHISSQWGKGTKFTILLPIRVATLRGLIVRAASSLYVIPIQQIRQVIRIRPEMIEIVDQKQKIRLDGEKIEIIRLSKTLGLEDEKTVFSYNGLIPIVILAYGAGQIACIVDELIQVQEIVVRSLGSQLKRVKRITGAVILGDGEVALVLDPLELIQGAINQQKGLLSKFTYNSKRFRILVADDSVTSRTLIQKTLNLAGYDVTTAEDGMEALKKFKDNDFDLVISDVDMPRMSGFTLTERIRSGIHLNDIPVILVTALDTPEDRLHGQAAGANAYIIKRSYEEKKLIKVVYSLLSKRENVSMSSDMASSG